MTQQPYYPPQQPQYPPQGYPQQAPPVAPAYPQYPAGGYAPPQAPPPQPPVQLATGTLDDFYAQPTGGGAGISWKGKPDGSWVQGIVPRDVTNGDVQQEVGAPNTQDAGRPKFYRDGRPMFVMAVPLQMQPSPEFPDGEARLFVRGQLREELSRAMAEAGAPDGRPRAGDIITVTLVQRKQGRGAIPQNIFAVHYQPANPGQPVPQAAPAPVAQAPIPQQPVYQQPVQQPPAPQPVPQAAPVAPSPAPVAAPVAQPVQQQAPVQAPVQQAAPVPPPSMTPEQAGLLARLTGQQA